MENLVIEPPKSNYHRLNVYTYIDHFCGYEPIEELLKYCQPQVYENFFLTMFKTGGRVSEALGVEAKNFFVDKEADCLVVTNMALEKRYKKDKLTGNTIKVNAIRKPFPILLSERLSTNLLRVS